MPTGLFLARKDAISFIFKLGNGSVNTITFVAHRKASSCDFLSLLVLNKISRIALEIIVGTGFKGRVG